MNSRIVVLVCAMLMVSPFLVINTPAAGTVRASEANGRAVTLITNVSGLQNISTNLAGNYELANDIDASETVNWNGGAGFLPMGSWGTPFRGTFDGKGFRITGLHINRPGTNEVGLFSIMVSPGVIQNVDLECNITGRMFTAGICAYPNGGTIADCTVRGLVNSTNSGAGGICGGTGTIMSIQGCVNYASVSTTASGAGGIAGSSYATMQYCGNTGSVYAATGQAGGLVGALSGGSLTYSFAAAKVSASTTNGDRVGGLVGYYQAGSIDSCYAASNTTGRYNIGGLVGYVGPGCPILRSFCAGSVTGTGDIGGFVGYNQATISDCYSITTVMGPNAGTGFFGAMDMGLISRCYAAGPVLTPLAWSAGFSGGGMGSSNVANSFWDTNATGRMTSVGGGTGKTTAQMMTGLTFTGASWDFTNTWGIIEGQTYPYLRWRYPTAAIVSGMAYSDGGVTPAVCGTVIRVIDSSGLSVGMGDAKANATGVYWQIVQPGPVVALISGIPFRGAALRPDINPQGGILDVQGGKVIATCGANTIVNTSELVKAKRRFSSSELPYNATAGGLVLNGGISFATTTGTIAVLGSNITATGGDITFGGPVRIMENSTLAGTVVKFDSSVTASKNLVINATSDVTFAGALQANGLTIINARDVRFASTAETVTFDQQSGTGTTAFGNVGLSATTASVKTAGVTGRVNAGALSVGTGSADITGLVGGNGGRQGADAIVLLSNILPGTHFFDGIDLYKFTPNSLTDAIEDEPYTVNFTPMNPGDAITWAIETNQGWLSSSAGGRLNGTPGNGDVGKGYVNVIARNGPKSLAYNLTISVLNVNDAPQILTQNVLTATEDEPYSVYYSGSDIDPTADVLVWSMTSGAAWLRMDQNNLHGTPANRDVGVHAVTVTVSDGKGGTTSSSFNITVANVNDGPTITSVPLATATQGQLYNFTFTASDIDANDTLTWTVTANATWLSINSTTRTLQGTPENKDVGTLIVTVGVKDATGAGANLSFVLQVLNVNDAPTWATVPADQTLTEGQQLVSSAKATDIDVSDSLRYTLSSVPASGITIDTVSGALLWASAVPGSYLVTVTATDGIVPITCIINVTVAKLPVIPNSVPAIDPIAAQTITAGKTLTVKITGKDVDVWDARNLTFSLVGPLTGMVISSDGNFVWTPAKDQSGVHTIRVQLSDGKNSTTTTFTVTVKKAAEPAKPAGDTTGTLATGAVLGMIIGAVLGAVVVFAATRKPKGGSPSSPPEPVSQNAPATNPAPTPMQKSVPGNDDPEEDFPDEKAPAAEPAPPMKKAGDGAGISDPKPLPPSIPPPE